MEKLVVDQENVRYDNIFLYKKVGNLVHIFHPKTIAEQVIMSDGVDIEEKLIGISADVVQAAQTAVEAFQKANQAFNALPDLSGYATIASVNNALATKAGTAIVTTTAAGLCPKLGGGVTNFLRADGTWATPPDTNTIYSAATQTVAGLMSAEDKKKLDGIAAGAQVNPSLSAYATTASVNTALAGYLPLSGGTLTNALTVATNNVARPLTCKLLQIDRAQNTDAGGSIVIVDKNNALLGVLQWKRNTEGMNSFLFTCYNTNSNGGQDGGSIAVSVKRDGTVVCGTRTPPVASNSTEMASTAWTRARIAAATGKGATTFSLSPDIDTLALDDFCDWSPNMVTKDMLEAAKKVINEYSTQAIFYGFWYELNDENYFFTYDLYDQQNFSDNAILALSNENVSLIARTEANEMIKINLSPNEMIALHKYALKTHKQTYMDLSLERKNEIINIQSETELKEKMGEYGLLEEYETYMKSVNTTYLSEMNNA